MIGRTLGDIYGRAQPAPSYGNPVLAATAQAMQQARGGARVGTPQPGAPDYGNPLLAATNQAMAQAHAAPFTGQAMPAAGGNTNVASVPGAQQVANADNRITQPTQMAPGMQQQPMGAGSPNQAQLSPQAQAWIAQMMQQRNMTQGQHMVQDRGVYAGQQAAAPMQAPPMGLPQLFSGGQLAPPPVRRA